MPSAESQGRSDTQLHITSAWDEHRNTTRLQFHAQLCAEYSGKTIHAKKNHWERRRGPREAVKWGVPFKHLFGAVVYFQPLGNMTYENQLESQADFGVLRKDRSLNCELFSVLDISLAGAGGGMSSLSYRENKQHHLLPSEHLSKSKRYQI